VARAALLIPLGHGLRWTFEGAHRVPAYGPAILASNHTSYLDPLVLAYLADQRNRRVRFLAKAELFDKPGLGWGLRQIGQIPPLIFTGLRLSLGVGWMVLIAAEMLAQNPGLGKFVWDEFQNGSSSSLAKIMVAVLTIGLIGVLLDRLMLALQTMFTYSATR
jgi:hypothetical protein